MINGSQVHPFVLNKIIRNALVSNSKRVIRALHVFFANLSPENPDGSPRSQLVMICEIISQQMRSPNEILAGATARFVSQIQQEEIIAHLMPSLIQCIASTEVYVRKNALDSLVHLASKFPRLVENEFTQVFQMLTEEDSWQCQTLAFKFIAKVDSERAFKFIISIASIIEDLHPEMKYIILVFLNEYFIALIDDNIASYEENLSNERLQILLDQLLRDDNNEVVLECSDFILSHNFIITYRFLAIKAIIRIFIDENDNSLKLGVLQVLKSLQRDKSFHQIIVENLDAIAQQIIFADFKLRCSIISFVSELLDPINITSICSSIFVSLQRNDLSLQSLQATKSSLNHQNLQATKAKNYAIESVNLSLQLIASICLKFQNHISSKTNEYIQCLLKYFQHESFSQQVSQIFFTLISKSREKPDSTLQDCQFSDKTIIHKLYSGLQNVDSSQLSSMLWLISHSLDTEEHVQSFCQVLISNKGLTDKILTESDDFLSFFFCLVKCLLKSDKFSQIYLRILKIVFQVYNTIIAKRNLSLNQFGVEQSIYLMNTIISALHSGDLQTVQEILNHNYNTLREKHFNITRPINAINSMNQKAPDQLSNASIFSPIDLGVFSDCTPHALNRSSDDSNLAYSSTSSLYELNSFSDQSQLSKNVVQLTSFGDDLYAECIVLTSKFDVVLDLMLINRHDLSLYNISFVLILPEGMSNDQLPTIHFLRSGDFETLKIRIRLNNPISDHITPSIIYHIGSVASDQIVMNLDTIRITRFDQIHPKLYSADIFKNNWTNLQWEKKIKSISWNINS
ncbi:MAG: coatomer subunit beta, partial [Marteilia pararefringens]